MYLLKIQPSLFGNFQTSPPLHRASPSHPTSFHSHLKPIPKLTSHNLHFSVFPLSNPNYAHSRVSKCRALSPVGKTENVGGDDNSPETDYLAEDGVVYKNTLRLVECSMFASVAGLAYFLSNSLAIENYFGCFFPLPIVITSLRWGIAAGRKTMVATALLLLILSGPVKALTYVLMHGFLGFTMGTLWRLRVNWGLSVLLCSLVRAMGSMGYVLISSFLIRENILALITINIHASLSFMLTATGINTVLSMDAIYTIFGTLLLLNCGCIVFLLHFIYALFLSKLGMKASLALPNWLENTI
ncbi:Protein of unknown function DUF2232 [Dillenia turbinata]|uniref:Uncharacterized protein n=1 Tax=Dillenia turbinata TaxID=194707 RepID=A0AAN8UZ01_9MAGN